MLGLEGQELVTNQVMTVCGNTNCQNMKPNLPETPSVEQTVQKMQARPICHAGWGVSLGTALWSCGLPAPPAGLHLANKNKTPGFYLPTHTRFDWKNDDVRNRHSHTTHFLCSTCGPTWPALRNGRIKKKLHAKASKCTR